MSKDLLLEIGTEEVPAHVMPDILAQLKEKAGKALEENRLKFEGIRTLGTPRRTALLVSGLAEKQEDVSSESRGPSVKIAFDAEGKPTKAAQGFARGQHIDPKDFVVKDGYVYAEVEEKGKPAAELLASLLPELISRFPSRIICAGERWSSSSFVRSAGSWRFSAARSFRLSSPV
jgi:glycyl-tRNA synthetase beta chain